ncbi:MAG: hypothetical protein H6639_00530 [Caldilineaceae bacterium]|nr:hypothetical protein [Caldilineaceae bacterium]
MHFAPSTRPERRCPELEEAIVQSIWKAFDVRRVISFTVADDGRFF